MGKGIHRLTDREVQAAKPRPCMIKGSPNFGKPIDTVYSDGAGLYLKVTAAGTKSWVYRYMIYGKSKVMGLGPVHTVSLSKAREHARQHRETKYDGLDPIEERDRQATIARVGAARAVPTFADAAEEYIAAKEAGWRDTNEGPTWRAMFSTHAALLMPLPVDQIDTPLVLRVIKPIWTKRYKLARKLQSRIEAVLAAATVSGYRQGDNPAQWKGYIDKAGLSAPASAVAVQPR
jgi:hypothetical protein